MTWSLGATCDQDGRTKFDAFLKDLSLGKIEAHPIPKVIGKMDLPYPGEGTIYDYMYDVSGSEIRLLILHCVILCDQLCATTTKFTSNQMNL